MKNFPSFSIILAIVLGVLVLAASLLVVFITPPLVLRELLGAHLVWGFHIAAILMLLGCIGCGREFYEIISKVPRLPLVSLIVILVCGSMLVHFAVPRANRIFFDEQVYENVALTVANTGEVFRTLEADLQGGQFKVYRAAYMKQPGGHPYVLSLFFRVFGPSLEVAHWANNFLYLFGVVSVFLATLLLFSCSSSAAWAACFFALTPVALVWSNTAAAELGAASFSACALAAAGLYARKPRLASALLLTGVLGIAVHYRPEALLILLPTFLAVVTIKPLELRQPRFYWLCLFILLLIVPAILHFMAVRESDWGSGGSKFAWAYFLNHLKINSLYFLNNERFPALFAALAVVGAALAGPVKVKVVIVVWFALSWGIFLGFHAGGFIGANERFALMSSVAVATLAGLGTTRLMHLKGRQGFYRWLPMGASIVVGIAWATFYPILGELNRDVADPRNDTNFVHEFAMLVPPRAVVIAHIPGQWLMEGKSVLQAGSIPGNGDYIERVLFKRYPGGVYFHWGYWCNLPNSEQFKPCSYLKEKYRLEKLRERDANGQHYFLSRVLVRMEDR
ncbi:glycosyltransferase family 39 protein [Oligoflexia bacterium]|nr:glycosyltransferase family 39 protein [Oligoflexia bacterium]